MQAARGHELAVFFGIRTPAPLAYPLCVGKDTVERAREDKREGKSPSTQAGEFVREEMEHIREGEHGARSAKQAIAIGLSKARRAGVKLPPPKKGTTSKKVRRRAEGELKRSSKTRRKKLPEQGRRPSSIADSPVHGDKVTRSRLVGRCRRAPAILRRARPYLDDAVEAILVRRKKGIRLAQNEAVRIRFGQP
jgi:hypothetical protein